jgi:hypothetical protein
MMNDFIDLVNIAEEFKDMRYIIRVSPIGGEEEGSTDLINLFAEHGKNVAKKADSNHNNLMKKIESFEKNTRALLKSSQSKINSVKKDFTDEKAKIKKEEDAKADAASAGANDEAEANKVDEGDY